MAQPDSISDTVHHGDHVSICTARNRLLVDPLELLTQMSMPYAACVAHH